MINKFPAANDQQTNTLVEYESGIVIGSGEVGAVQRQAKRIRNLCGFFIREWAQRINLIGNSTQTQHNTPKQHVHNSHTEFRSPSSAKNTEKQQQHGLKSPLVRRRVLFKNQQLQLHPPRRLCQSAGT